MLDYVTTVNGDVPGSELGVVLPHEHLLFDATAVSGKSEQVLADVELAIREAGRFRDAGGSTIVELTNLGIGRNPEGLRRIADATELNIVMGCGWYHGQFYDARFRSMSTNAIADEMVKDIRSGVEGSGVRAGIIGEIGCTGDHIEVEEERSFHAAALAHLETGRTVSTHADYSPVGLEQIELLRAHGVDPRRVVVGHCDSHPDPAYHEEVARRGSYVQFDNVRGTDEEGVRLRLGWVLRLVARGFLRKVLISQDICYRPHLREFGGKGYDYILTGFVSRMLEAGLSRDDVHTVLVRNPRSALTGSEC